MDFSVSYRLFSDNPKLNDIELGWRFIASSWGKGYATEAAQHILQIMSALPQNHFFSATALANNIASIGVMKKIGMRYVKTCDHSHNNFDNEPAVLYRIEALVAICSLMI
ncbi:GNAT family N-acetyltransferase [Colwellia sp. UCD-KL20]|uniref:GNAT family N-acetyltransferase n=1 Tax=Colwellia sp. UCD-KL20 TaxID=1917165 RepID=UPI0009F868E4|nr:GNAT family N-acetyltransferase [Colwellia sp. UCD-KL20]